MERKIIPTWSFVKKSYSIFKHNVGLLITVTIIQIIVSLGTDALIKTQSGSIAFILNILSFLLLILMSLGLIKISLLIIDNKPAKVGDLFGQVSKLWDGFVLYILYFLILLIPIIFIIASITLMFTSAAGVSVSEGTTGILLLLGIIFALAGSISMAILSIKYSQSFYLLIDKDIKPVASLKESGRIMKGAKWKYFVAGIILSLVNLLGLLALIVGLLVSIPVTMLAYAMIYRLLLNGSVDDSTTVVSSVEA